MSWTENLTFTAPDGKVTTIQARDWLMWTNWAAWLAATRAEANGAAIAELANDQDITPEFMRNTVNAAVAAQAPALAAMVTGSIQGELIETIQEIIGSDNAEQAEMVAQQTIQLVSARLAAAASLPISAPEQEG